MIGDPITRRSRHILCVSREGVLRITHHWRDSLAGHALGDLLMNSLRWIETDCPQKSQFCEKGWTEKSLQGKRLSNRPPMVCNWIGNTGKEKTSVKDTTEMWGEFGCRWNRYSMNSRESFSGFDHWDWDCMVVCTCSLGIFTEMPSRDLHDMFRWPRNSLVEGWIWSQDWWCIYVENYYHWQIWVKIQELGWWEGKSILFF